jgi:hypothetical protein
MFSDIDEEITEEDLRLKTSMIPTFDIKQKFVFNAEIIF